MRTRWGRRPASSLLAAVLALLVCVLPARHSLVLAASAGAGYPYDQKLRVVPKEIHGGDTIYVSGSGWPAAQQLYVMTACPNWNSTSSQALMLIVPGPETDAHGSFTGFKLTVGKLQGTSASPCRVYAGVNAPFGPGQTGTGYNLTNPAHFSVLANKQKLGPCDTHICLKVRSATVKGKPGLKVVGWPGSQVTITVTYPGGVVERHQTRLDWRGSGVIALSRGSAGEPLNADVAVQARLGTVSGDYAGHIAV